MKEGHLAYLACSSVIMESLVKGHAILFYGIAGQHVPVLHRKKKTVSAAPRTKNRPQKTVGVAFPSNVKNDHLQSVLFNVFQYV